METAPLDPHGIHGILTGDAATPTPHIWRRKQRLYKWKTMKIAIGAPLRIVASTGDYMVLLGQIPLLVEIPQVRTIPAVTIKFNIYIA